MPATTANAPGFEIEGCKREIVSAARELRISTDELEKSICLVDEVAGNGYISPSVSTPGFAGAVIYTTDIFLPGEDIPQKKIADVVGVDRSTISTHHQNIYDAQPSLKNLIETIEPHNNRGELRPKLKYGSGPTVDILERIWNRIHNRNEHFMGVIVGREGSGKSQTAIKIGYLLDPYFNPENVLFHPQSLLELLRDENYHPGDFYVLDEAGVGFGSRTWQDRTQRLANQALQLIRDHNIGVLFTLPRLGELDSQTQGRLQAFYEINDKVPDEYVSGGWKWIDPDRTDTTGKVYKKYPRTEQGERVTEIRFSPPPDAIIEPYQERKREFQQEIYNEAIEALEENTGDKKDRSARDIVADILENEGIEPYIKTINNGSQKVLAKELISAEYDLGEKKRDEVKSLLLAEVDDDVM